MSGSPITCMLCGKARGPRMVSSHSSNACDPRDADDHRLGMEQGGQGLAIPLVGCPGIALQEGPQLLPVVHRTATGFTGQPVPRTMRSGPMVKRNSQRPSAAHRSLKRAVATLSIRWRPMAVIPI